MIIDPANSKNVASVKDSNGKEIERIYDKYGNLVFKNWNTLEGPFPIGCFTSSERLRNYRIYGNTIQDGTPTPENPVEVQGCGERTENLFDISTTDGFVSSYTDWSQSIDGKRITVDSSRISGIARGLRLPLGEIKAGTYNLHIVWDSKPSTINIRQNSDNVIATITSADTTFSLAEDTKIEIYAVFLKRIYTFEDIMLTSGSSAPSEYIPYGYKIPVTVNGINLFDTEHFMNSNNVVTEENNTFLINSSYKYAFSFPVDIGETYTIALYVKNDNINNTDLELSICYGEKKSYNKSNNNIMIRLKSTDKLHYITKTFIAEENWISIQGMSTHVKEIMLVKGLVIPDYEPYHEPITTPVYVGSEPLHKIDDYADYVDYKRGVVVRRINKIILRDDGLLIFTNFRKNTGGNTWRCDIKFGTQYGGGRFTTINNSIPRKSSHFSPGEYGSTVGGVLGSYSDYIFCPVFTLSMIGATDETDSEIIRERFLNWLDAQYEAGTPVTVWYVLSKPKEEVLLFSQEIPTNIGNNTFSCTISPAPSKVMIQYKKK